VATFLGVLIYLQAVVKKENTDEWA